MLSKKAWRDHLHKKRKTEIHNVMRRKPDFGVGGMIHIVHQDTTGVSQNTNPSFGVVKLREGVVFIGDPAQVENVMDV
jgi:hypothetical protein